MQKQRNFCVNLLTRAKKEHFANLSEITKNSVLFSNEVKARTTVKLVENNEIIDDEIETAKLFHKQFVNIVKKLEQFTKNPTGISTENNLSEVEIAIAKYRNHPSIIAIAEKMEKIGNTTFGFDFTSYEKAGEEDSNLKIRKVSQKTKIPVRIIKGNIDAISYFPTRIKYAEVTLDS